MYEDPRGGLIIDHYGKTVKRHTTTLSAYPQ